MMEVQPCLTQPAWLSAFNAVMNVVQAVLLAALAQRAVRKNREERESHDLDVKQTKAS